MKRNQSCEPRLHVQADAESVHVCECTHSYIHSYIYAYMHTYMLFITYRNDTPLTATRVDENQCSGAGLRTGPALPMPVTGRSDTEEIQQHRMGLKLVSPRVEPIAGIQAGLRCSDLLAALRFRIRNSRNGHPQFPCRKKELLAWVLPTLPLLLNRVLPTQAARLDSASLGTCVAYTAKSNTE